MVSPWLLLLPAAGYAVATAKKKPETVEEAVEDAAPPKLGKCVKLEKPLALKVYGKRMDASRVKRDTAFRQIGADFAAGKLTREQFDDQRQALLPKLLTEQQAIRADLNAANREWQAKRAELKAQGYEVFDVTVLPSSKGRPRVTVAYYCPPDALPPEWEAMIEKLEQAGKCVSPRTLPGPVNASLRERGWKMHRSSPSREKLVTAAMAQREQLMKAAVESGMGSGTYGRPWVPRPQPMLCPPGVTPTEAKVAEAMVRVPKPTPIREEILSAVQMKFTKAV